MSDSNDSLYSRLGGYDAIAAVADAMVGRLVPDSQLGRFWAHRGEDGLLREKQLLIDFLCSVTGGPMLYTGRDLVTTHRGMRISESDWTIFMGHLRDTLAEFSVPETEAGEVVGFFESTKPEVVEV